MTRPAVKFSEKSFDFYFFFRFLSTLKGATGKAADFIVFLLAMHFFKFLFFDITTRPLIRVNRVSMRVNPRRFMALKNKEDCHRFALHLLLAPPQIVWTVVGGKQLDLSILASIFEYLWNVLGSWRVGGCRPAPGSARP